jgi:hypothetical protein
VSGRYSQGSCKLIGAPFLGEETPQGRCQIYHPPPDPDRPAYEGLWRRRQREKDEQEAAQQAAEENDTEE